jgi:IS30 family transposase
MFAVPGAVQDRLAVREISARYLTQHERIEIADLRRAGVSIRGRSG